MKELEIHLPGGTAARLLYLLDFRASIAANEPISWLQLRKTLDRNDKARESSRKSDYLRSQPIYVKAFVERLMRRPEFPPDAILVPPSWSRLFEPYLDGLVEGNPGLVVIDGMFAKRDGFESGADGQGYQDVFGNMQLTVSSPPESVTQATRLWIVDDIFNSGNTAGSMAEHLRPFLKNNPEIVLACPLYVAFEEKINWESLLPPSGSGQGSCRQRSD